MGSNSCIFTQKPRSESLFSENADEAYDFDWADDSISYDYSFWDELINFGFVPTFKSIIKFRVIKCLYLLQ